MAAVLRLLRGRGWFRFSLHTALLLVICVGSFGLLWLHWHPWRLIWESGPLPDGAGTLKDSKVEHVYLVDDGRRAIALSDDDRTLWHGDAGADRCARVIEVPMGMYHSDCVATYAPWMVQASDSLDLPDDCAGTKALKERMRRSVSFTFDETPFPDVLAFFERKLECRILVEQPPIRECSLISLRVTQMRTHLAFGWACILADMSWRIEGDTIVISRDPTKQQSMAARWVNLATGEATTPEVVCGMKRGDPMAVEPRGKWALVATRGEYQSCLYPLAREEFPNWVPEFESGTVFGMWPTGTGDGLRLRTADTDETRRTILYYRVRYDSPKKDHTLILSTQQDSRTNYLDVYFRDASLGWNLERMAIFPMAAALRSDTTFSPDDSRFFTAYGLHDSSLGGLVAKHKIAAAAFSADSRLWVAAEQEMSLLDARDGKVLADAADFALPLGDRVTAIGRRLASWLHLPASSAAGTRTYTACCFSDDGKRILAATDVRELRLWENARPTGRWGVLSLSEFWLSAVLTLLLVRSAIRDRRLVGSSAG